MFVPVLKNEDAGESKRQQEIDELEAQLDQAYENRKEWIINKIINNDPIPNLSRNFIDALYDYLPSLRSAFGFSNNEPLCRVAKAMGYSVLPRFNGTWRNEVMDGHCVSQHQYENYLRFFNPVLSCLDDGYNPSEWERKLYDKCAQVKAPESKEN